jgi:hypothetical protein
VAWAATAQFLYGREAARKRATIKGHGGGLGPGYGQDGKHGYGKMGVQLRIFVKKNKKKIIMNKKWT